MTCKVIHSGLAELGGCVEMTEGSRVTTQCLYPSFDPVHVFVAKFGDGFRIHDGSGAFRTAWLHGREDLIIKRSIDAECRRFHTRRISDAIALDVSSVEWLPNAILSVANASSLAAHSAVARITASSERLLVDRIEETLLRLFGSSRVAREVEVTGKSGGKRKFDVVINVQQQGILYVNGVSAHHNSISSKYVAFSDAEGEISNKLAIHDRPLEAENIALLQQVSLIMPIESLAAGAGRAVNILN